MASLGFKLNGEFVTQHARDLVLSGDWREALYFLTDSFEGMNYDIAIDILKGNTKIVGENNDLNSAPEDKDVLAQYTEEVNDVYLAGRLNFNGKRFKAYGYVYYATDDDAQKIRSKLLNGSGKYKDWPHELGYLYMNNKSTDECFMVHLPNSPKHEYVPVLFEPDTDNVDPPIWLSLPKNAQQSIDLLGGTLPNIGHIPEGKPGFSVEWSLKQVEREEQHKRTPPDHVIERNNAKRKEKEENGFQPDWHDSYQSDLIKHRIEHKFNMGVPEYTEQLRAEILAKCAEQNIVMDTFKFKYEEAGVTKYKNITYPRDLLLNYSLSRTNSRHLMTDFEPVSPGGIKMEADNRYHTDAWVACGFDLDYTIYSSNHPNLDAFNQIVSKVQSDVLNYKTTILNSADKEFVLGTVRTPETFNKREENERTILVVPHAGEEFAALFYKASALICETGGKLAHLVLVGREMGIPIVREENATQKYRNGMTLNIDLQKGNIIVQPQDTINFFDADYEPVKKPIKP